MHSRRRILVLILAIGALGSPAVAHAQSRRTTLDSLRAGDTVRVWAVQPRLNGTHFSLARVDQAALWVTDLFGVGSQRDIPLAGLHRLDVRRGKHRSVGWILAGTALGIAAGSVIGAYGGAAIAESGKNQGDFDGLVGFVVGGLGGGIVGGITGGVLGARRRPNWQVVTLTIPIR